MTKHLKARCGVCSQEYPHMLVTPIDESNPIPTCVECLSERIKENLLMMGQPRIMVKK